MAEQVDRFEIGPKPVMHGSQQMFIGHIRPAKITGISADQFNPSLPLSKLRSKRQEFPDLKFEHVL